MAQKTYSVRIRLSWWVRPLMHLAVFNASIGIPVSVDRITEIIVKHGTAYELEQS